MIFIYNLEKISDIKFSIGAIHYCPFDKINGLGKTKEELLQIGAFVNDIPEPMQRDGYSYQMFYNPDNGVFYEYTKLNS